MKKTILFVALILNFGYFETASLCKNGCQDIIAKATSLLNYLFFSTHNLALTNASTHGVIWSLFFLSAG